MELLINPITKANLDKYIASPTGALLLQAPAGSGKGSIARQLAADILNIDPGLIETNSAIRIIAKQTDSITIEDVRSIASFLKLKTTGAEKYRRAVIIEYIENMGREAQNAFLKGLEEPPEDTIIILTTNNPELLLPTITSRVQTITILPPKKNEVMQHFSPDNSDAAINKAYLLSEGSIGLMTAILDDDKGHPLLAQIELAKDIYKKTIFERLNLIDNMAKSGDIPTFLVALERVSQAALYSAAKRADSTTKAWNDRLRVILDSQNSLKNNPNSKLLLSNLFIKL